MGKKNQEHEINERITGIVGVIRLVEKTSCMMSSSIAALSAF